MSNYKCSNCGYSSFIKLGKCSNCGSFGTLEIDESSIETKKSNGGKKQVVSASDIKSKGETLSNYIAKKKENKTLNRFISNDKSFNDFFGGGLVKGSINLISGLPGVGKSTLLGYIAKFFPENNVIYISGEETTDQILDRVNRMKKGNNDFNNLKVYNEKSLEEIIGIIEKEEPDILIIDSLQMLETVNSEGESGGLKQQKYITKELVHTVKSKNIATFLVGHVTSSGEIAGAQFVEHLVDAVIRIDPAGERGDDLKFMKNLKNRFSGEDILVYEMYEDSIKIVSNKKLLDLFIQETAQGFKGNTLSAITLPNSNQIFLVEIQAIIAEPNGNYVKNNINNFNNDQFANLVKIIGDNIDGSIYQNDVSINIVSPLRMNGDELSLGILMAIISHGRGFIFDNKVFLGRVGFRGEIKSINRQRSIIQKLIKYGVEKDNIISNERFKNIRDIVKYFHSLNKKTK